MSGPRTEIKRTDDGRLIVSGDETAICELDYGGSPEHLRRAGIIFDPMLLEPLMEETRESERRCCAELLLAEAERLRMAGREYPEDSVERDRCFAMSRSLHNASAHIIDGTGEAVVEEAGAAERRRCAKIVIAEMERLKHLINRTSDGSRIQRLTAAARACFRVAERINAGHIDNGSRR